MELYKFQKEGIDFLLSKEIAFLADEMGLGKSAQAIGLINKTYATKILIICPAYLKNNWVCELKKWLTRNLPVVVINGEDFTIAEGVTVVSYERATKNREKFLLAWDILIIDEAHYLKNYKSKRTSAILGNRNITGIFQCAKRKIFISGTPMLNRPIELWTILHACGIFKSWYYYTRRYCSPRKTKWGIDLNGASNLEELNKILKSTILLRRTKKEVMQQLPEKTYQIIELPSSYEITSMLNDIIKYYTGLSEDGVDSKIKNMVSTKVAFEKISELRHKEGLYKTPYVAEHVVNVMESGENKVVVFCHHVDVAHELESMIHNSKTITGLTPIEKRNEIINKFQTCKEPMCLIGTIGAMGYGVTLTAARLAIFAELDWTPAKIKQAEDRIHRIGQHEPVLIQYIVVNGGIDIRIAKIIIKKKEIIGLAIEDIIKENYNEY